MKHEKVSPEVFVSEDIYEKPAAHLQALGPSLGREALCARSSGLTRYSPPSLQSYGTSRRKYSLSLGT